MKLSAKNKFFSTKTINPFIIPLLDCFALYILIVCIVFGQEVFQTEIRDYFEKVSSYQL